MLHCCRWQSLILILASRVCINSRPSRPPSVKVVNQNGTVQLGEKAAEYFLGCALRPSRQPSHSGLCSAKMTVKTTSEEKIDVCTFSSILLEITRTTEDLLTPLALIKAKPFTMHQKDGTIQSIKRFTPTSLRFELKRHHYSYPVI